MNSFIKKIIFLPIACFAVLVISEFAVADTNSEALLIKSLREIENSRLDQALHSIDNLLQQYPNFRLAQLIKGDLLLAHARPLNTLGDVANAPPEQVAQLREEAKVRLQRYRAELPQTLMPKSILQMEPSQKYALLVDTTKSRLYVYKNVNGEPQYFTDYYISTGKKGAGKLREGDQKTPIGVYHVIANLPKQKLADLYGSGAFPLNYPNEWDKRQGRNGSGIWLHGTPTDTYSRPPRASDGCVALTNPDLEALGKVLQIGRTPVVISEHAEWISPKEWQEQRQSLLKQIEVWRSDWESRDAQRYLAHYAKSFSANGENYADWSTHKQQVNAQKTWVKVKLNNISLLRYSGDTNVAVITFDQDYKSNNLSNQMRKRQYWLLENNQWKIIFEGAV
jgi:murein L,D-transpeptidase YafK